MDIVDSLAPDDDGDDTDEAPERFIRGSKGKARKRRGREEMVWVNEHPCLHRESAGIYLDWHL